MKIFLLLFSFLGLVQAQDNAFKLTLASHSYSVSGWAQDLNLRHSSDFGTAWLGYYHSRGQDTQQARAGWERSFGDTIRLQPSLQVAAGGFVGGSLNLETGDTWVFGVGLGRTNLRPYVNLNVDPNDSWQLMASYRPESGQVFTLSYIRDNRENPEQQHLHFIVKLPLANKDKLSVDLLYKRGLVEQQRISKLGATLTYDWSQYSLRAAYEPNPNFTVENVWRLSAALRF
ncbi:MAG: hypothetical protein RLZZ502_531 [Pseudomonadota bacterium]|jgi:hypothetical protein